MAVLDGRVALVTGASSGIVTKPAFSRKFNGKPARFPLETSQPRSPGA